jgi:hypothetical protein
MTNELRPMTMMRFAAGAAGGVVGPGVLASVASRPSWLSIVLATAALAAVVAGELAERSLFFTTASPPR